MKAPGERRFAAVERGDKGGVKETKNNRNSHEVSTKSGVQIAPCKSRLRDMPAAILATKHFCILSRAKVACVHVDAQQSWSDRPPKEA